MGPLNPKGIISSGRRIRFAQKTPSGGIHAVLRIRVTVNLDCDTYSTQPLQKRARMKLRRGVIMHPTMAKSDGKRRVRPKLQRVRRTP
jgi:hypothetical protein